MKIFLVPMLMLCACSLYAQKEIPDFGKIDKSDLLMKECESDKDAEAYKLIDVGYVHYERGNHGFKMQMDKRTRIKILKEKGLDNANIKVRFINTNQYENISDIAAITYNLDAGGNIVITKLDKGSIFTKKIDNHHSEIVFTLPEVKTGSVIEFKYSDNKESISSLKDWYFQDDIPTRFSQYKISVPEFFKFMSQVFAIQKVEKKSNQSNDMINGLRYNLSENAYTMRNVAAIRDEPYMGSSEDYRQRVQFQLSEIDYPDGSTEQIMSTWPKLTDALLDDQDFGAQMRKNIPRTRDLDDQLKGIKDEYAKMTIIYNYVRKNMEWNAGESIYTNDGIKSAWDKKSGTNSEINLILLNLLKDAGVKAYPLLVSTRDNGTVNPLYPFLSQFNNVLAYVPVGDKFYVLNGSDKYNPARLIPYDVMNTDGFLVDKDKGSWINLTNEKQLYKNIVSIFGIIDENAIMHGTASVSSYDYCKNPRVKKWKADKESFEEYFTKDYSGIKIDSLSVTNAEIDSLPLVQNIKYTLPLNSSGDYKYFTINLFDGLEKNPFIADHRFTDIEFGYNQYYSISGSVLIPDNYAIEELPKSISMITPDTSIILKRIMQLDEDALSFRVTLEFKKPVYYAAQYADFKEFYKTLFDKLNEQIVLKKK